MKKSASTTTIKKSAAKKHATGVTRVVKKKNKRTVTTQRVLPFGNGWVVKLDHADKFFTVTTSRQQAINIATELAKNDHGLLIVHKKNGAVQTQKSFAKTAARKAS